MFNFTKRKYLGLFSKQKIAAIIGYQISDEFKLDKNSKFAFKITTKLD